jgi:hypothetical protein
MTTNITADHQAVFEALSSGDYRNFALFSCFVKGEPAAAIVAVNRDGDGYTITPLFVSITPSLVLTDHDGRNAAYSFEITGRATTAASVSGSPRVHV